MSGKIYAPKQSNVLTADPNNTENTYQDITGTSLVGEGYALNVASGSSVSSTNSSTVPLAAGVSFTGDAELNGFSHIGIQCQTDQGGTIFFDFSGDGVNWDTIFPKGGFRISPDLSVSFSAVKLGRYCRVRLVNDDAGDQTYLRLYTYFGNDFIPDSIPVTSSIQLDNSATSVRPTVFTDEVITGKREGVRHFNKFGYRTGLLAASGEQTIWAASGNFTPMTEASTFDISYTSSSDGAGTTGARTLFFDYVDSDGLFQTATHTLGSTGSDVTSFSGLGINRIAVASSGSANKNANSITVSDTDGSTTQAFIPAEESVTQQPIFHTDSNSFAIVKNLRIETVETSGGSSPRVLVKGWAFNRDVETSYLIFRETLKASNKPEMRPIGDIGFRLTSTDVLYFEADTDTDSAEVSVRFDLMEYKISREPPFLSKTLSADWTPQYVNIIGYWELNESPAVDGDTIAATIGPNGVLNSDDANNKSIPGKVKNAIRLDGGNDSIDFGDSLDPSGKTKLSVACWLQSDTAAVNESVLGWSDGSRAFQMQTSFSGGQGLLVAAGGGADFGQVAFDITSDWVHAVMVYDGTLTGNANRLKLYLNGELQTLTFGGSTSIPAFLPTLTVTNFEIGDAGNLSRFWDGNVDDVAIWDAALTADEVNTIYQRQR